MPDIDHTWGSDVNAGPTGDLALVDGLQLSIERIVRRLMTRGQNLATVNSPAMVGEVIFHPNYGGSIPQRIGDTLNTSLITAVINFQMGKESSVAKSPAPVITITPFLNGVTVLIVYWLAVSGLQRQLSFNVNL